jgi:hypothetical protein
MRGCIFIFKKSKEANDGIREDGLILGMRKKQNRHYGGQLLEKP